jgi:hypothetical protein
MDSNKEMDSGKDRTATRTRTETEKSTGTDTVNEIMTISTRSYKFHNLLLRTAFLYIQGSIALWKETEIVNEKSRVRERGKK